MAKRTAKAPKVWWKALWKEFVTDRNKGDKAKLTSRQLASMLNMLATLLDNGMPLQKALLALSTDTSLRKQWPIIRMLQTRLVEGSSLHAAMSRFPGAFPPMVIQQVKLGESNGNLPAGLMRIVQQMESWLKLRGSLIRKLSYPALITTAGAGLMAFMLTIVVPQFEVIYSSSKVDLPWVTQVVTFLSRTACKYAWFGLVPIVAVIGGWLRIRSSMSAKRQFHAILIRLPLAGAFVRDLAVLHFLRSVHALSEAGFVPTDATTEACGSVQNLHVRQQLQTMASGLKNGTSLSSALGTLEHLIPGAVRQLMMVGEHSGDITKSCEGSCEFIQTSLERRIGGVMGMIEPVLTVGLAALIGWVVLAMYMPMFKMFDVLDY